MASLFDEIDAASQVAISAVFGDAIRIIPMRSGDGNYGAAPDPGRAVVDTVGTYSSAPASTPTDYPKTARDGAPLALGPSEIWIDREAAALIGYLPKRGDIIELQTEAIPKPKITIASVEVGDHGDLRIVLAK